MELDLCLVCQSLRHAIIQECLSSSEGGERGGNCCAITGLLAGLTFAAAHSVLSVFAWCECFGFWRACMFVLKLGCIKHSSVRFKRSAIQVHRVFLSVTFPLKLSDSSVTSAIARKCFSNIRNSVTEGFLQGKSSPNFISLFPAACFFLNSVSFGLFWAKTRILPDLVCIQIFGGV